MGPALRAKLLGAVSLVALASIVTGATELFYFRVLAVDAEALEARLTELPYQQLPGLRTALVKTFESTSEGEVVAIVSPRAWADGYEYIYARALYMLPGREVVATRDDEDRLHLERLATADAVLVWGADAPPDAEVIWEEGDAALVRKPR